MPTALAVLIALALGRPAASQTPASPEPPPTADCPVATGADDWAGRYEAGEGIGGENPMVMSYQANVFRDGDGRWRAYVMITGQTTYRELRACGVASPRALELWGRERSSEDDETAPESILTIERSLRGSLRFRFREGSYLLEKRVLDATRQALPPWAGVFTAESCATAAPCWRYRFEVGIADDGWRALVSVDGPDAVERFVARGEDGDLAGGNSELWLTFVQPGPGDARRGPPRRAQDTAGKLVRRKDGSTWVGLDGLPGPSGLRELPATVQSKP
jgi:hypothetical protein